MASCSSSGGAKNTRDKIDAIFSRCKANSLNPAADSCDLRGLLSVFWPILDNTMSLVDFAGVLSMADEHDHLDAVKFPEFFNGIARVKYPTGQNFRESLIDDINKSKHMKVQLDSPAYIRMCERNVMKLLLKFDLPLRRVFSTFAGQSVRIGGGYTWDEVRRLAIGIELDGVVAFASAHSIIPNILQTHHCQKVVKDIMTNYPLTVSNTSLNSVLHYPQFQLLLCFVAIEKHDMQNRKGTKGTFAKKVGENETTSMSDILLDLFKKMGLHKSSSISNTLNSPTATANLQSSMQTMQISAQATIEVGSQGSALDNGAVVAPTSEAPQDQYTGATNHNRQAMMLRMEHLFDEMETKLLLIIDSTSETMQLLSEPGDEMTDTKPRLISKPVVIGDAVPVPVSCPEAVEQLLQAALAHHNLGSYEESIKFLEASRLELYDMKRKALVAKKGETDAPESKVDIADHDKVFDVEMYIVICKGNVYQSCGDDEQSLLQYMEGLNKAKENKEKDWEIICLNSIGILAYYSLRYEVAFMCFSVVGLYRSAAYGQNSADTATAWNNEACSLYCMNKRRESRVRFEKAWNVTCKVLGHRAPRAIAMWKNLEKARRAHASIQNKKDLNASIGLRDDADRLLTGGEFIINAIPPEEKGGKKKKGGKGSKKKKK